MSGDAGGRRDRAARLNFLVGAVTYLIVILLSFWVRTSFVSALGDDYLSLYAVLLNVIAWVSIAEAGLATAVVFRLYGPVSRGEVSEVAALLHALRYFYRWAIVGVLLLSVVGLPFMLGLSDQLGFGRGELAIAYVLAVGSAVATCTFAVKKSLLLADQRNYVVAGLQAMVLIGQSVLQILVLRYWGSFAMYLLLQAVGVLSWNLACDWFARRSYSRDFWKRSIAERGSRFDLRRDVQNLLPYKVGALGLNSTYSILIAALLQASLAGVVSNFSLVVNSVNGVLMQAFNGVAASIGSHNAEGSRERRASVFAQLTTLSVWVFGACAIALVALLNPFMALWLGANYMLGLPEVVALVAVFYVTGINQIPSLYRSSLGYFRQTRLVPMIALVVNIVLAVVLSDLIGLSGVFIAAAVARLLTFNLVDPILVSRQSLGVPSGWHFLRLAWSTLGVVVVGAAAVMTVDRVAPSTGVGLAVAATGCGVFAFAALGVWMSSDPEFRRVIARISPRR